MVVDELRSVCELESTIDDPAMIFEGLGGDPADAWNAILECVKTDVLAKELFEYYQELLTEVGETPNLWTIPKITDSPSDWDTGLPTV